MTLSEAVTGFDPADLNAPIYHKDDIDRFESTYEVDVLIPCAIVGCHQPHKKGMIVLLHDGELSRVGHVCGRRLLGDDTFTLMHRDLEARKRRAQRERFISSPEFDPEAALAALKPWNERVKAIGYTIAAMRLNTLENGRNYLGALEIAVERNGGLFETFDYRDKVHSIRVEGGRFLTNGWQDSLADAKSRIQRVARKLQNDDLTDSELSSIVRDSSEAHSLLLDVAKILDGYDRFLRSWATKELINNYFPGLKLPAAPGTIDRAAINKLGVS